MKYTSVVATLSMTLLLATQVFSGDEFKSPRAYGEELGESPEATIAEVVQNPEEYNKKTVTLMGTIDQVCQNKGCWMYVTDGKNRIRVDFKNYGFFMPWDSEGKRVKLEGKINHKMVDKNVLKHWAEDSKDAAQDPEEITEDQMMVMITASGVLMEGGSALSDEQEEVVAGKKSKEH